MKRNLIPAIALIGVTLPSLALASGMDANGDGVMTIEEVQAVHPDVTPETFSALDADRDGTLSEDEVMAGVNAGVLPKTATN
ncbi:EF-hand domain-containing protein [uncultured Shimia sp.]|uniref:EF-hand domain-containing protein n=1 Tax=uncultured Shimia sp. TaxID=573152 RepID=UPI002627B883|nr:EF-hand domain-containing protein [uncultured Shimia sp.]